MVRLGLVASFALGCQAFEEPAEREQAPLAPDYSACVFEGTYDPASNPGVTSWDTPCENQECAVGDASAAVLSQVKGELARRGVGDRYRFLRANEVGADQVELAFVASVGWFESASVVPLPRDIDDSTVAAVVEKNFCLAFPETIVTYGEFLKTLRACDPEVEHTPCDNALSVNNGCTAIGLGFKIRPSVPAGSGCHTSRSSFASVSIETGSRVSCSLGGTVCE